MHYLDANVLIDALVDQGTTSRSRSLRLFRRLVEGNEAVATTELVIAEVIWFLRTRYAGRFTPGQIRQTMAPVVANSSIDFPNREIWARVLDLLERNNHDVPDLHLAALMEGDSEAALYSYDRGLDRIPGLNRIEP